MRLTAPGNLLLAATVAAFTVARKYRVGPVCTNRVMAILCQRWPGAEYRPATAGMVQAMERPYSGYADLIGYELIEKARDFAKLRLVLGPQHMNRMQVPHGGVLASVLDSATGFAVAFADGPEKVLRAVTVTMNVQFVGQAKAGDTLFATGRRNGGGRTIAFASAEVHDQNGGLVAKCEATYRFLDRPSG